MIQEQSNRHIATRIMEHSMGLFLRYGVRSITLDEIANELGISKKTIYQHFQNKAEIVHAVSQEYMTQSEIHCTEICENAQNAIDELFGYMNWMVHQFKSMSPTLIDEIKKYYPKSWEVFQHHETEFIMGKMKDNLKKGISEGLYRENLNVELITRIRIAQIDTGFDTNLFPLKMFSHIEVQTEMLSLYIHGIVTDKGKALIQKHNLK